MSITFKLEKDGKKWHAYCLELKGCHTYGSTKGEALKHLKNAVMLYLEDEIENQSLKAVITVNEINKKASHV